MNFVVIDVETANPDLSSICQVGIAPFRDGVLHDPWESLVNPRDSFDPINVSIHGIDEEEVRLAPDWHAVYSKVRPFLQDKVVVSHTAFDRLALIQTCEKNKLTLCECNWLDSAKVVRRAWPQFSRSGYGLANVAAVFGITYRQHNALEDARCAGEILMRAISETGLNLGQWIGSVKQPLDPSLALPKMRTGNPDGPLYGEVIVFTGALSLSRTQAANAASNAGCEVDADVTKRTTLLVVGDQDVRKLAGHEKSSKHRKAENLIARGQGIRILGERDFIRMTAPGVNIGGSCE